LWVEKTTSRRRTKRTGMKIRGNGNSVPKWLKTPPTFPDHNGIYV
jgi:hypothetical protein